MNSIFKIIVSFIFALFTTTALAQCPAGPGAGCNGSGTSLNLYWVGVDANNNGDWTSPCSWRVGHTGGVEPCQAPRSIDNVFFTSGSFFSGSGAATITINTQARCNNFFIGSSINSLTNTPTFSLNNPGFLEVYGNFLLQPNINWNTVGGYYSGPELFFKSTNAGNTIETAGHTLGSVVIDGIGGEWKLQDDLDAGCFLFLFGEWNTSDGSNDHNMKFKSFSSHISGTSSAANRILELNSSTITITGSSSGQNRYNPYNTWQTPGTWESYNSTMSNTAFNSGTSKIVFTATNPFVHLGALNYNVVNHTGSGRFYDHFGSNPCVIDTLETNGYFYFHHEHAVNVMKINSVGREHNFFYHQTVNTDLIVSGDPCNPTKFRSEYNRILTMPTSVSADPMVGYIIENLRCNDNSGGSHNITGFGSGTTTGWNIIPVAARDLYWVGNTNTSWTEPTNWSTSPSGVPLLLASDCPPLQTDNVFFTPMANGKTCHINSTAKCNDMTWTITAATTFSGGSAMNIYGNLLLDTDINFTTTSTFNMYGDNANTIFSAGKTFNWIYLRDRSQYTLQDNLNFNYTYIFQHNSFNSGGFNLSGRRIYFRGGGATNFSNSVITLSDGSPWYHAGSQTNVSYSASSTVTFTSTNNDIIIRGWGGHTHLPNFTLQNSTSKLLFQDHLKNRNVTFDGDVLLNGGARFFADWGTGTTDGNVQSVTVNGDLTLSSGKTYEFGLNNNLTVTGTTNSVAACFSSPITMKGINGNPFTTDLQGPLNFGFTLIGNSNSLNAHTVNNCSDIGGNTNWTFNAPPAVYTYYWRAMSGSGGTVYNNPWSTSGHWTTVQTDIDGVISCIPGPYDNVVFDNLSFSGAASNISINSTVSCNNITATATNVNLTNTGRLMINGNVLSDGTMATVNFTGNLDFISNTIGKTIDFGGTTLGSDVTFVNQSGGWTLTGNKLETNKDVHIDGGTVNTNGENFNMRRFHSSNSSARTLNLGSSTMNLSGSGNFQNSGDPANIYTWNTNTTSNLTLNAGTSTINFNSSSNPILYSSALNFNHVNFTSTSSVVNSSPMVISNGLNTEYMKFDCSARIYGDHFYDTLEFTAGNVYKLEGGSVQTLNAPNGVLLSTGSPGNEIAIKSISTGIPATFHKLNTGGSMLSFCFDYVSVEDNIASSDDGAFSFFTGINSNDISAAGIWDFTRPLVFSSTIEADADVSVCPGSRVDLVWNLVGTGPYVIEYDNGGATNTITLPNSATTLTIPASHYLDKTYTVTSFKADNCGVASAGTIIDADVFYDVPNVAAVALGGDRKSCFLNNDNTPVYFQDELYAPERIIATINDASAGVGLGNTLVKVAVDPVVQSFNVPPHFSFPYLQRRFGITPTNQELATIRLYFTQGELNALATAYGSALTINDLDITKYSNNVMDFSGAASLMTITGRGVATASETTSANVLYLEFQVSSFSHFIIHPKYGVPLPVELLNFDVEPDNNSVAINWETASEINSSYFEVWKSEDAEVWSYVGKVNAVGNSTSNQKYAMKDNNPIQGISYYKLIQYDLDGESKEYGPRTVEFKKENINSVYPNPANNLVYVDFFLNNDATDIKILFYNNLGQIVKTKSVNALKGNNTFDVSTGELSNGIYTVRIISNSKTIANNIPLVIQK